MTVALTIWCSALTAAAIALAVRQAKIRSRQRKLAAQLQGLAHAARLDVRRRQCLGEAQRRAAELDPPRFPPLFPCEFGEDVFLWLVFESQTKGYYIECGAFDGLTAAATYPFEAAGWTGLLVEPMPTEHALCAKRRPFSHLVQTAVGAPGGPPTVTLAVVEGAEDSRSGSFLKDASRINAVPDEARFTTREIEVPLSTLDRELEGRTDRVDFIVLDVEGAELDVLKGFSLDRYRPRLLLIEDLARGQDTTVPDHLAAQGYRRVARVGVNDVYLPRDDDELLARVLTYADRPL